MDSDAHWQNKSPTVERVFYKKALVEAYSSWFNVQPKLSQKLQIEIKAKLELTRSKQDKNVWASSDIFSIDFLLCLHSMGLRWLCCAQWQHRRLEGCCREKGNDYGFRQKNTVIMIGKQKTDLSKCSEIWKIGQRFVAVQICFDVWQMQSWIMRASNGQCVRVPVMNEHGSAIVFFGCTRKACRADLFSFVYSSHTEASFLQRRARDTFL